MKSRSFGKMEMRVAASTGLLAILLAAGTVASSASERVFVTLTQSFKIKVPYGETVIPAGTRVEIVSVDDPATCAGHPYGAGSNDPKEYRSV